MKTYIIAEMAWSYTGSYNTAIELLNYAKKAEADAIGIHITNMETYMTRDYKCIAGQTLSVREEDNTVSIYEYLDNINMKNEEWINFDKECQLKNIDIVAMCNDMESFLFSKKMRIKKYVIAASLFYEYELIKAIVEYKNDLIIRIGGASLKEIDEIVGFILKTDANASINLLAGIQLYPTPIEQLHIASITELIKRYPVENVSVGLADHIDGADPNAKYLPCLALPFGITTLEKHITTRREEKLEDYEAALSGDDFIEFVRYVRTCEKAIGDGKLDYLVNPQNEKYRLVLRKRIVAKYDLPKGTILTNDLITYKRNDYGVELEYEKDLMGKQTITELSKNQGITLKDVV